MADEYIPVERAAELLRVSTRHTHRACQKASVRTKHAGKRILYHLGDVEVLAEALGADYRTTETPAQPTEPDAETPTPPPAELVPAGDLLRHIRELEDRLAHASRHIGQLEGQLEMQQRLLHDAEAMQQRLAEAEAQQAALRAELKRYHQRPWWQRLWKPTEANY